ncbi:siderophore-interacting protein [Corynebacterium frankenforstense]|uniref:siderophore-interacting protein n=1 Tax=Corynebacterium frankenforstense TaxID=1230998 RepID=UPI0026EF4C20|nr:siderophore-interacting protein [Corynebacterium frankenforstense]
MSETQSQARAQAPRPGGAGRRRKSRRATPATVTGRERLSPEMIRLSFDCPGIRGAELPFADHYVKLLFVPEGAGYSWPFDLAEVRETRPRTEQPVMRTYTLRKIDTDNGAFDIDFVVHGADGVAGPWAERAEIGEVIPFAGPGGTWAPRPGAARQVFVGDESALPAVAAGVGNLSDEDVADVFLEVSGQDAHVALPVRESVRVHWVHRGDATPGTRLVEAVRAAGADAGEDCEWFVHGVAEMVREMRRFLFVDAGVPRGRVSISGYWRLGMVEDEWQASKREFTAAAEAAEAAGVPGNR